MYDNQCENCCFAKAAEKNVIPHHKDYILCTYHKEFYMRNSTSCPNFKDKKSTQTRRLR